MPHSFFMPAQNIFLIGPMGAGKTTIGRQLAQNLACEFIDSDREIEQRTGVDIPTIFEFEGEEGFREREAHKKRITENEGKSFRIKWKVYWQEVADNRLVRKQRNLSHGKDKNEEQSTF